MAENSKRIPIKRKTLILIIILLTLAAACTFTNQLLFRKPAALAEVSIDGKVVTTLDLNKEDTVELQGYKGGSNHLTVQDGNVWVDAASCPDKVCISQGRISLHGEVIVCMPNRMMIQVTGENP